ncbi:N-acetylmuramoyl-L-alanine amidase [Phenylobacterium sp.]|uniref:N-acetylmuramoyl-L-alanine amidase family protein n=2 Tax=Phenylobacterium sp. TaxID=1871053 RepID=UPI00272F1FA1|nr:N-acetylmuramoyl-L-alanine amidase [Phenylobacterium sp.]MDP1619148.1 N-acetylmuramoyl-L-alanine amidase [Phenylobacterium sp.]
MATIGGLAAVAVSHAAAPDAGVLGVRLGGDATETRLVIDLDRGATGKVSQDGSGGRVVMSLPGVDAKASLQGSGRGLIRAWMIDQSQGAARLQIDLAGQGVIKRRFLLPPADGVGHYRYVIDVAAVGAPTASFTARPASRPTAPAPKPLALKKVIVIDAGHGGKDPGARGARSFEKDVNLAAALALQARLERSGKYKVVMTRKSDVYVPLESRVQIARRAGADLFISLHADAGADAKTRGTSVYTLSEQASGRAAQFVSKDDWFMNSSHNGGDNGVRDILFDLTQRATKNRSATFAELVLARADNHMPLLRRSHRDAGFVVLLAPDVPAILLEMGFVTNAEDEAALLDADRRTRFMNGVGDAIDDYFAQQTQVAAR